MRRVTGRRSFLKGAASVLGTGLWSERMVEAAMQNVPSASKPSDLKITDVRVAMVGSGLIRLDTNQGIYGIGENRD